MDVRHWPAPLIRRTVPPVMGPDRWLTATPLGSRRVILEPLRIDHAEEMAPLLNDPALHTFIGGEPATIDELRRRYTRICAGRSEDGSQCWLNWVVRRHDDAEAVGFVQATVTQQDELLSAEVAWMIGTEQQHRGFAQEAAELMVGWLREEGPASIVAYIHPDHRASAAVARRIGLTPTGHLHDGEVRWTG